ncbi:5-demethoxyubiquinol-8 5-hydroxylase UbiM [Paraburkholderia adhaesiva]|uniref:5-demethoxyubiquinol-8 5-hydroxylase UbiM n=1 Tax=Paraburkholderia adhaesiva TaxID=2883244 RepID=UPI001F426E7A|nr:5-demethoxyubiquinol-8 5-hydroxylase UbiM [Paraburkholderia adhaesiva]
METDIVIVGAGPVGLCLARSLSGSGLRIVVVEQQSLDEIENPKFDGREIALTQRSARIMQQMGLWDRIESDERSPLSAAKVFNGSSPSALEIGHELGGHNELGWLVSNCVIRKAAYDALRGGMTENGNVTLLTSETVTGIKTDSVSANVTTGHGLTISASLIVAADNRFSTTRKMMGIAAEMRDFGKSMLVCRMTHDEPHHHTAWEWFGYDQTLALLPLNPDPSTNAHRSSVVLTLPGREIAELARLDPEEFRLNIEQRFARRLGSMELVSTRHVYPLVSVYPGRFVGQRFATVGDAAVGMHPVTAHGFNFGLVGVETLSKEILDARLNGLDIAADSVLARYESRHRRATKPLYLATRFITDVFTNSTAPARLARDIMLRAASHFMPFRKAVAASLTG